MTTNCPTLMKWWIWLLRLTFWLMYVIPAVFVLGANANKFFEFISWSMLCVHCALCARLLSRARTNTTHHLLFCIQKWSMELLNWTAHVNQVGSILLVLVQWTLMSISLSIICLYALWKICQKTDVPAPNLHHVLLYQPMSGIFCSKTAAHDNQS